MTTPTQPTPETSSTQAPASVAAAPAPIRPVRCFVGGILMGFANVVPGISGGAMLLMVGVYERFITSIAELTQLKIRFRTLLFLGLIAFGAATAILASAGPIKDLVLDYRWLAFSVFIGLRLGAIPIVLRWAKPFDGKVWAGVIAGLLITAALATFQYMGGGGGAAGESTPFTRFLAGLAGASATILPGMDGSYFLLLMGEYVPILKGIDTFKDALLAFDIGAMWTAGLYLLPVAFGVALGLGGVSMLLRWAFAHHRGLVAGILLGVLVGAVGGLWPFREGVPPQVGDTLRGILVTPDNIGTFEKDDYRMAFFTPTATQILTSIMLVALGIAAAYGMSKLDPEDKA